MTATHPRWRTTHAAPRHSTPTEPGEIHDLIIARCEHGAKVTLHRAEAILTQINPSTGDTRVVFGFRHNHHIVPADMLPGWTGHLDDRLTDELEADIPLSLVAHRTQTRSAP